MYFMTFFPDGENCFQPAEMTKPCRYAVDEVDFLVRINNPDLDAEDLIMEASERFIADMAGGE